MHSWGESPHCTVSPGEIGIGPSLIDGIRIGTMTFKKKRAFHFSGASWLLLCAMADGALAQDAAAPPASTQLPEITVTAPSPIVRRRAVVPSQRPVRVARTAPGRNRERAPEATPAPAAPAPQQGVLPIVTDQFATVTVVPNEEIRRQGTAQLGDLLFSKPGITGSTFAPGAASRPIIRGLDVNRVGIVENGNNAGGGNFAFHADAYGRKASDYSIPSYPYLFDQTRPVNGRQPNSAMQADGASIGGSYIFQGGFIGAAITQNDTLYRIPGIDGADHQTRIDGHQTKFTAKGEYRPDAAAIDAVRFWAGATDYHHNEIGLADPADPSTVGIRQKFTNKEQEGRLEVQMMPFNARFAAVTTAFGLQAGHQELTAPSPDDPTSPLNGLWDPNRNNRVAGYVFNELKFSETTKAQIAGRVERVNLTGTTPEFIPDVFDLNVDPAAIGPATPHNLHFTPKSASVGLLQDLPWGLVASITGQYVERAPKPAELFSRGAHDATTKIGRASCRESV